MIVRLTRANSGIRVHINVAAIRTYQRAPGNHQTELTLVGERLKVRETPAAIDRMVMRARRNVVKSAAPTRGAA